MNLYRSLIIFITITCFFLFLYGCETKRVDVVKLRDAISKADDQFMETFNQGDAAGVAAMYTDNGQLLPPNSNFVTGTQAIQNYWQGTMNIGINSVRLEIVEIMGLDNTACEVGKYSLMTEERKIVDKGKYIVLWKKVDDNWKLHRDIWNSSMPSEKAE